MKCLQVFEPVVQSVINCDCRMFGAKPKPARIGLRIIRAKRTAPPSLKASQRLTLPCAASLNETL